MVLNSDFIVTLSKLMASVYGIIHICLQDKALWQQSHFSFHILPSSSSDSKVGGVYMMTSA